MIELPVPAGELTPHAAPMLLIDDVTNWSKGRMEARTTVRADCLFFMPGRGLPAYVGFEIMAQAIGAYDGWMRRVNGEKPAIGFLLGCRKYETAREWFEEGEVLTVEAVSLIDEGEMRSFDCRIVSAGGGVLASSVLNVYRPTDANAFLAAGQPASGL